MNVRILPVAAAILALAGCDVIDEIQPSDPVPVPISSLRVDDLREARDNLDPWDQDGTGPDVFIEIQNTAGAGIGRTNVIADADVSQTLSFTFDELPEAPDDDARLYLVAFDQDGDDLSTAESMGSSVSFSVEDLRAAQGGLVLEAARPNLETVFGLNE